MRKYIKNIFLSIWGLFHGTIGSYTLLLGYAFAFPETEPGMKDYEEDMYFVPLGFIIMIVWIILMLITILKLRKKISNLVVFLASWISGVIGFLIFLMIYILKW